MSTLHRILVLLAGLYLFGWGLYDLFSLVFRGTMYAFGKGGPGRWLNWPDDWGAIVFVMTFYLAGGAACLWSALHPPPPKQ